MFKFGGGNKPALLISVWMLVVCLAACSDRRENELAVFKALDESLENANLTIARSNQAIYMELEEKSRDPATSQKATIWLPKAMVVRKYASDLVSYIDSLKDKLKKEAGLRKVSNKEFFNENDREAVNTLFKDKEMGNELYGKIKEFRRDILSIDIQMGSAFRSTLLITALSPDIINSTQKDIRTGMLFNNISVMGALATLNKFKNDILVAENRLAMFCNTRFTNHGFYYDTYSAIVAQSYDYIKAGGRMEITAGVGYFSVREAKPEITVNGKRIAIDESGVAVYKFKASTKTGKHTVPVKIDFIGEDGIRQVITKDVEYTVLK